MNIIIKCKLNGNYYKINKKLEYDRFYFLLTEILSGYNIELFDKELITIDNDIKNKIIIDDVYLNYKNTYYIIQQNSISIKFLNENEYILNSLLKITNIDLIYISKKSLFIPKNIYKLNIKYIKLIHVYINFDIDPHYDYDHRTMIKKIYKYF